MSQHTTSDSPTQPEPVCPRHLDRVSYARCNRCMRPTCGQCQTHLEVGMICPDCYRDITANAQPQRRKGTSEKPIVTYALIGINVVVYLLQMLFPGRSIYQNFALYWPRVEETGEYYRALTSGFLHSQNDPTHLLLNMVSLYLFGTVIERMLGSWRYLCVYLLAILGGSAAVWILDANAVVVGASGGIFGLMGAYLAIMLALKERGNVRSVMTLIGINVVYGFVVPGISWQAHLGGFVVGAMVTLVFIAPQLMRAKGR